MTLKVLYSPGQGCIEKGGVCHRMIDAINVVELFSQPQDVGTTLALFDDTGDLNRWTPEAASAVCLIDNT